jgi:hypothetical protein
VQAGLVAVVLAEQLAPVQAGPERVVLVSVGPTRVCPNRAKERLLPIAGRAPPRKRMIQKM